MVVSASMTSWSNRTAWQRFLNSSKFNCVSPVLSNLIIFSSKYSSDGSNPFLKWKMILFQKWVRFKIWSDPGVRSKVDGPKGESGQFRRSERSRGSGRSFQKWTVSSQSERSLVKVGGLLTISRWSKNFEDRKWTVQKLPSPYFES